MKEKGNNKTIYGACIVLFVLIVAFGFFMYKYYDKCVKLEYEKVQLKLKYDSLVDEVSRSNEIDQSPKLKLGSYSFFVLHPETYNEEYRLRLEENNDVIIGLGEGCSHIGKYEVDGNKLICHITKAYTPYNEESPIIEDDVKYTFEILDNTLKLIEVFDVNNKFVTKTGYKMMFPAGRIFTYNLFDSICEVD